MTTHASWEGVVLEVGAESFWARLVDCTDKKGPDIEAEFAFASVGPEFRSVVPGMIFHWTITGDADNPISAMTPDDAKWTEADIRQIQTVCEPYRPDDFRLPAEPRPEET